MNKLLLFGLLILAPIMACAQTGSKDASVTTKHNFSLAGYPKSTEIVHKTDAEWKASLNSDQYSVLRQEGTERPFTGALLGEHRVGVFTCAACGNPLFSSDTKFESGTGWPSFYQPIEKGRVREIKDADGERVEIRCARCGGHLGHVFDDGPQPTGLRYCMNSVALAFDPK
ncbi:MAG: peptide-methionine (R)-S-oxide reductase MsrB [Candidatus Kapaibacterium sp.]|jgi:peptide-methionine (R)-S-oxide reductase